MAEEVVAVRQDHAEVVVLNDTAAKVLEGVGAGLAGAAISERLAEQFEVEPAEALADVEECLAELHQIGLLVRTEEA